MNHYPAADSMWVDLMRKLDTSPIRRSRNGEMREIQGWCGQIDDARNGIMTNRCRDMSHIYAAGELLWYLSGDDSGEFIEYYAPSYSRFIERDGRAHGAYGKRWSNDMQLETLLNVLYNQSRSRQAVITAWNPNDLKEAVFVSKKDLPCTISLQFLIRDCRLNCITTMRSNDVWLGFPYDVFCFTNLQCLLAEYLGLEPGFYQHQVGSMHMYERDWNKFDVDKARRSNESNGFIPTIQCESNEDPGFFLVKDCDQARKLERKHRSTLEFSKGIFSRGSHRWNALLAIAFCNGKSPSCIGKARKHIPLELIESVEKHQERILENDRI